MGFRQIENDIKSGAIDRPAPVLLCGEERFLIDFYERRLEALYAAGGDGSADDGSKPARGPDVSVFYGNEAEDDMVMGALDTFPMLSPLRVVVVKGHPGLSAPQKSDDGGPEEAKTKKKDGLAGYIAQMPGTARLIFSSSSVNKTRALYKAIAKHGAVYEFTRLDEADLARFARKRFRAFGAEIPPAVLDAFAFATGYLEKGSDRDLFAIENEAYKLASFALAEGRTEISQSDIEECMPGVLRTDVFEMLDAISTGRKADAVRLLENSLAEGESAFRLLSLLTGHFEIMLGCKELGAEGHTTKEITKILGERSDWRVGRLDGFARRFEAGKLKSVLGRLYAMERQIRSGDIRDRHALTVLLAEI